MRHQILEVEEEAVTIAAFDEAARAALARIPLSLIRDDALKLSAKLVVEVSEWRVETVELRLQCDHLLLAAERRGVTPVWHFCCGLLSEGRRQTK